MEKKCMEWGPGGGSVEMESVGQWALTSYLFTIFPTV